jgi:hypothetical protein
MFKDNKQWQKLEELKITLTKMGRHNLASEVYRIQLQLEDKLCKNY